MKKGKASKNKQANKLKTKQTKDKKQKKLIK